MHAPATFCVVVAAEALSRVGGVVVGYGHTTLSRSVSELLPRLGDAVVVVNPKGNEAAVEPLVSRVVRMDRNVGYAAAVNRGAADLDARCEVLVVLTRDADLSDGAIPLMVRTLLERPSVAVVGPVAFVGTQIRAGGTYRPGRSSHRLGRPEADLTSVDWVDGSVMVIRRSVFDDLGGFDEGTFMYVDEVAFCHAVRASGLEVFVHADAIATQTPGAPSRPRAHGYLVARNHIRLARRDGAVAVTAAVVALLGLVVRSVIRALARSEPGAGHHLRSVPGIVEGIVAGLAGRSGPPPERVIRGSDVVLDG